MLRSKFYITFQKCSLENIYKFLEDEEIIKTCEEHNFHNAGFDSWATLQILTVFYKECGINLLEDIEIRNKIKGWHPVRENVPISNVLQSMTITSYTRPFQPFRAVTGSISLPYHTDLSNMYSIF